MSISLSLYDNVKQSSAHLFDLSGRIPRWRRSIRDPGGFWIGEGAYESEEQDMRRLFMTGLGLELREISGGLITWQGFISELEMTLGGVIWRRAMLPVRNAVKLLFSRTGDTLLTNGDAESGVWTAYTVGGTPTITQDTTWRTGGTYSMKIVATAGAQGAYVGQSIAISAKTAYLFEINVKITSSIWLFVVQLASGKTLSESTVSATGERRIRLFISESNAEAGNVDIWLETTGPGGAGTINCDDATFRTAPVPGDTGWYDDTSSQTEFGRIEDILVEGVMTSDAAQAKAQTLLRKTAWPRSLPPASFESEVTQELLRQERGLRFRASGYWATLNYKFLTVPGTDDASAHVTTIADDAEFVTSSDIEANTLQYQVESIINTRAGDALVDIAAAGDASFNRWSAGMWEGRRLIYGQTSTDIRYRYNKGKLYDMAGNLVMPWLARPSWIFLDDAPLAFQFASSNVEDDPRRVYAQEIEFEMPSTLRFKAEEL